MFLILFFCHPRYKICTAQTLMLLGPPIQLPSERHHLHKWCHRYIPLLENGIELFRPLLLGAAVRNAVFPNWSLVMPLSDQNQQVAIFVSVRKKPTQRVCPYLTEYL